MKAYNIDDNFLKDTITLHGAVLKQVIAMEELAELTQQISKSIRGEQDHDHLTEEFADVMICMEMVKLINDLDDSDIQKWIDYKMNRQAKRDEKIGLGV